MKTITFFLICLISTSVFSQGNHGVHWVKAIGSLSSTDLTFVSSASDKDNNIYVIGTFRGKSITLWNYPNTDITIKNADYNNSDNCYVLAKYNVFGKLIWAKNLNESYSLKKFTFAKYEEYVVETDINNNILLSFIGKTKNQADTMSNPGLVIAKLDTLGNQIWSCGTNKINRISNYTSADRDIKKKSLKSDSKGNVYSIIFANDPKFPFIIGNDTITIKSESHILIKYDKNGKYQWSKLLQYNYNNETWDLNGAQLELDNKDNIFVYGTFSDSMIIGNKKVYSYGSRDVYILKLNPNGLILDSKTIGGINADVIRDIVIDTDNRMYFLVSFMSPSINYNNVNILNPGLGSTAILKLDSNWNYIWSRTLNCTLYDLGYSISVDRVKNVLVSGNIEKYAKLYFANDSIYGISGRDNFLAIYDQNGQEKSIQKINSNQLFLYNSMDKTTYLLGNSTNPLEINNQTYYGQLFYDWIYVVRFPWYASTTGVNITKCQEISIYPNPTCDVVHFGGLSNYKNISAKIFDSNGNLILIQELSEATSYISIENLCPGLYFIHVGGTIKKLMKI